MKEFEKTYPADPRALVAMRLRHFLDVTKDVDFTAQLVEKDKNKVFADAGPRGQAGRVENVFSGRKTRHRRRPGLRRRSGSMTFRAKVLSKAIEAGARKAT